MTRAFALALLIAAAPAAAQQPGPEVLAAHRAAMAPFAWMDGEWRGEAVAMTPAGEQRVTQTERVGPMLDGMVKMIEGKGYMADGRVGFNAMAVISWDARSKAYTFRSYHGGHGGSFTAVPEGNGYTWELPAGPGVTMRYHARLENGRWRETGERIAAGKPPVRIFEMTLTRVGDTDWPAAGGPGPR